MKNSRLPISVVLLTRNEERNVSECLQSCDFAVEIVVVDDDSTDQTVAIAESMGAKVFHRSLNGDWGAQKMFGIQKATCPWIFLIDADERVTPTLRASIRAVVTGAKPKRAYLIQRENHFTSADVKHGCLRPDWVLRLLPREGAHSVGKVHEAVVTPFDEEKLEGRLKHFPYASWDSYYRKIELYSRLSADKYLSEGKHCNFVSDILLRPLWAFFKVYVINRGFMDGKLGFIFSMNHCFYTMSKYVRYYYLKNYGGKI